MATTLILTGDVNLLNVTDPAVPFARVRGDLAEAALVFGNPECCLYAPPGGHSFHAAARLGTVLHPGEAWVKMQGAP